jgi:hypothetical protein
VRLIPHGLTLAVGLLASACTLGPHAKLPRSPGASPEPMQTETREFSLQNGWITVTVEVPVGISGRRPVVIRSVSDPNALLNRGIILVNYRLNWELLKGLVQPATEPPPEKTVGVWLLASPSATVIGEGYFKLIWADAAAVPAVIDLLYTLPEVDPSRIGMAGISTNGFKVLSAILQDRRLRAAVVVAACGDYHTFLEQSSLAMNGSPLDLDPAYDAWLRKHEPIRNPDRFTDTALLVAAGGQDSAMPALCAQNTADVFQDTYAAARVPQRFRLLWFETANHNEVLDLARAQILAWWDRWLLDDAQRDP